MAKKYKQCFVFVLLIVSFIIVINLIPFISKQKKFDNDVLIVNHSQDSFINIDNFLPLPDDAGKSINLENYIDGSTGYLEFEIGSKVDDEVNYEIYLTEFDGNNNISDRYVKVYLSNENDGFSEHHYKGEVLSYYDLRIAKSNLNGKLIYTGSIKNKQKQKFILRMWVADTYGYTTESKKFSVKLNVGVL